MDDRDRCGWANSRDERLVRYHDEEWGIPSHDDRHLFEMLVLEGAQAGLSWTTILKKRDGYRRAFADFDPERVARFSDADAERLMQDSAIVRNRLKIQSSISNARAVLAVQAEIGSLDSYLWSFVGGKSVIGRWRTLEEIPASTPLSVAVSKDLKRRGFRFVGPTTVYAFLEAVGIVNDHVVSCFRYAETGS